jgi:hypothetical protein
MPTVIKNQLNLTVNAVLTVAEVNGGTFPYAGVTIDNTGTQTTLINGLIAQVAISGVDVAPFHQFQCFVQRNLKLTSLQSWVALRDTAETVLFYQIQASGLGNVLTEHYTQPVVLPPGASYGAVLGFLPSAVFAAPVNMNLTLLGRQVNEGDQDFPLILR